jgi:hypothetical protein
MAESTTSLEQRKYLQSIVGTSDPSTMNPFDQNQPGLSGSGDPETTGDSEKELVDLPFRFTQWQLNTGNKAATGQWDRSATARSPYQSGQLALEMEGIQGQLKNLPEMNAAPTAPTLPEVIPEPTSQTTGSPTSGENANMRYGLPLKEYQIPSNMILGSRNPIEAARSFESKYKTPEERAAFGPTSSIQGYDVDAIMKASGWGGNLTEKYQGDENKATQTMFNNLGLLPASFDPKLGSKETMSNLATRDFTFNDQPIQYDPAPMTWVPPSGEGEQGRWEDQSRIGVGEGQMGALAPTGGHLEMSDEEWDQQFKFGQAGEAGTVGQTGFGDFDKRTETTIQRELMNGNAVSKVANKYGFAATMAVITAIVGGAAGLLFAPAGAAAGTAGGAATATTTGAVAGETAATGLAGSMGMTAGAGATTVNSVATMIAKYGVSAAAQMAGVPIDNPMFQMALAAAGGAYSGATGPASGVSAESMRAEQFAAASELNMSPEAYASQILQSPSIDAYVSQQMSTPAEGILSNTSNAGTTAVSPGVFNQGATGIANQGPDYKTLGSKIGQFGMKVGMNEVATAQAEAAQAGQSSTGNQITNAGNQATYDNEMTAYNTALEEYNQQVAQYETYKKQLEARSAEVQRLMGAYETDTGNWASRQALTSRQSGIQQQIKESIAGNKAYDPTATSTGVQGALWK